MSKTNDNSTVATLEDHGTLVDTELARVTGGMIPGLGAIYTQMISDTISTCMEGAVRALDSRSEFASATRHRQWTAWRKPEAPLG